MRHTASSEAVFPPPTQMTSWDSTKPRRSATVRSNSPRSDGSQSWWPANAR